MVTLWPRCGLILSNEASSIFRTMLSEVMSTASPGPFTHFFTQAISSAEAATCFAPHIASETVPLNSAPNADMEQTAANASTVNTFFTEHLPGKDLERDYYTLYAAVLATGCRFPARPVFRTRPPRRRQTA